MKGAIEVQDEGSQLAALLSAAKPGEQVIDLCAGAGGKTLALAAMMQGKGRLIATDHDKRQLAPIHERLSRAGVHNCDVRTPKGEADTLADIKATADLVLIDAPCTGTGTWRRNPDAKWRMRPGALEVRLKDQIAVLDRAAPHGEAGRADCVHHVLGVAGGEWRAGARLSSRGIRSLPWCRRRRRLSVLWDKAEDFAAAALRSDEGWLMTPRRTGTDGFFVSVLRKGVARNHSASTMVVITTKAGYPVRRRSSVQSLASLEYWITRRAQLRTRRVMTSCVAILAACFARAFANSLSLLENRGRRECRVRAAPAVSCAKSCAI